MRSATLRATLFVGAERAVRTKKLVMVLVEKSRKIVFQLPLFKVSLSWWIEDAQWSPPNTNSTWEVTKYPRHIQGILDKSYIVTSTFQNEENKRGRELRDKTLISNDISGNCKQKRLPWMKIMTLRFTQFQVIRSTFEYRFLWQRGHPWPDATPADFGITSSEKELEF